VKRREPYLKQGRSTARKRGEGASKKGKKVGRKTQPRNGGSKKESKNGVQALKKNSAWREEGVGRRHSQI